MSVRIRFRFNKLTGEVEQLLVEQERELPRAEHDATHEAVAAEVGRLIDRFPEVEIAPGAAAPKEREPSSGEEPDTAVEEPTVTTDRRARRG